MAYCEPDRLFLFALSTCFHCRAAREMLDGLKAPYDCLEVDLLPKPEQERALAELAGRNPALTFPTLVAGSRVVAGPLMEDMRRLAVRTVGAVGAALNTHNIPARAASSAPVKSPPGAVGALNAPIIPARAVSSAPAHSPPDKGVIGTCPSRLATGDPERDRAIICPCVFRDEDVAKYGRCYGNLYFSPQAPLGRVTAVPDRWLR